MIKCDYIEEAGQYYYQCIIEINKMQLVRYDFAYNGIDTFNIVHSGKKIDNSFGRIVRIPEDRSKIFNFIMS